MPDENNSTQYSAGVIMYMPYNEAHTRAKLIDPTIHKIGWTEDLIRRETTAAAISK